MCVCVRVCEGGFGCWPDRPANRSSSVAMVTFMVSDSALAGYSGLSFCFFDHCRGLKSQRSVISTDEGNVTFCESGVSGGDCSL